MQWTDRPFIIGIASGLAIAVIVDQLRQFYDSHTSASRDQRRPPYSQSHVDETINSKGVNQISPPPVGNGIESTIGSTPLIVIPSLSGFTGCTILAKCEHLNGAGGSPKDRVALSILTRAEAQGLLTPHTGDTVYEGTVGSTGISLATLCRAKGYLAHICMPNDQSHEKSNLLLKLGAVVERVPPAPIVDQEHFVNRARNLAREHTENPEKKGRGYFANQFETEANWRAHYEGTGPEIYAQCQGHIDAFTAGAGTGGTISGVATYLKEKLPDVQVVLADPHGSGLYNKIKHGVMFHSLEKEGTRRRDQVDTIVEGIGLTRSTLNFEQGRELIDDAVKVNDQQAMNMARLLVERDGIFVGSSSAVNWPGHTVVTILCDSGMRHLSKFWARIGEIGGEARTTLEDILEGRRLD
ncbi:uncharacterized protein Z520_03595 [Fonsecaea multimorphosa CBS 102226]|uniref:Tryptophan synthase beta chain-like PALP domain-containing protein n=1 Tax=Fonsecaea multimorphosa CBS 102226 TaxID=1442371 RepID=A0A0D2KW25_9EURO|nr:uncharacterized protein Z520_03595 [Fonsecaea multimorphosa CBS 102226]KIY00929.1 hypothetical protein Z520_03595 [Fonsecaea multimorphosa CBS 102226]OAL27514.1 hypothetical protein AYO22_03418 [Fonsecaea multimorphosa]